MAVFTREYLACAEQYSKEQPSTVRLPAEKNNAQARLITPRCPPWSALDIYLYIWISRTLLLSGYSLCKQL